MPKEMIQMVYRDLMESLNDRRFLRRAGMTKKVVQGLLKKEDWKSKIRLIINQGEISCQGILEICSNALALLSEKEPKSGWLEYIYVYLRKGLFPGSITMEESSSPFEKGIYFYLEVLRVFFRYEKRVMPFDKVRDFYFATEEETADSHYAEEFTRFRRCFINQYVYELMRIGREVKPFDTLAHVAGVHYVAMHVARQLRQGGVPIDLGLISGAAAGHDIGKYGCKGAEEKRIPYLHYYYTDLWCKVNLLPAIGHIASNHSTWDLELEDLPVESLVLIYADFRVKGKGWENGKEIMGFYSLEDSFEVILQKLDNVDVEKENRYRHVYAKLKDFENYMMSLGVNTDFATDTLSNVNQKDNALLNSSETVEALKHMAIEHNISLMHKLSHEISFGNVLETARSRKNWKSSRSYISIFEEYFTYMTQKQKVMTLNFLYELLMHREGDIRRQAAELMGNIIVHYDEDYRKEVPADVSVSHTEIDSMGLWEKYLEMIIVPDHKVTDRHKRWIGYALKRVVASVLDHCKEEEKKEYLKRCLKYYEDTNKDDATAFILLDSMLSLPLSLVTDEEMESLLRFCGAFAEREPLEIRTASLRFLKYVTQQREGDKKWKLAVETILRALPQEENISLQFLASEIIENWNLNPHIYPWSNEKLYHDSSVISDIFLENLKAATPWVIKAVNIELLLHRLKVDNTTSVLHVATHLSNLVKVSEQVTVRHSAGEGLVEIGQYLSLDQRNEVAIELTKGLEIGEYEFSKYIPQYLGEFALYLHPAELDEFITDLKRLLISTNEKVVCVALDTLGIMIVKYGIYKTRFIETEERYKKRKKEILGMLLSALADYREAVNQESFLVIGQYLFGSTELSLEEKKDIFQFLSKKLVTLVENRENSELAFFNNANSLNYIYRFISDYLFEYETFTFAESNKIAFFPGTYDPFSLGHKGIAKEIRDMGFMVYLALDEFSWSKKTQPRMIRREIITMSVANEENIYLFPDEIPVNIANPNDLKRLKELFPGKEVYMVAGSDVILNASSYKAEVKEHSIQTLPHIIFLRESSVFGDEKGEADVIDQRIAAPVLKLKLPVQLEDISSTRIRENIDDNRDISNLIDPVAQNFIYENSLYLREPQYKQIVGAKMIQVQIFDEIPETLKDELLSVLKTEDNMNHMKVQLNKDKAKLTIIRDGERESRIVGAVLFRALATTELYEEFRDMEIASHIRENTSGRIVLIMGSFSSEKTMIRDMEQLLATETLAYCLEKDFTYAVFSPSDGYFNRKTIQVLERQGFYKLEESRAERSVYVVDMKNPITLFKNIMTVIKEPFHKNARVLDVIDKAHDRLQLAMTKLYPGNLVLSFHAGVMHHRLVELITKANKMPSEPLPVRTLGKSMCVPFGKILKGMMIPNTVTKVLHTEKTFEPEIKHFRITQYPNYSPLQSQIRTIKSFNRPVILADDLLHKGYRIKELDPLFHEENLEIDRLIVGILSGRGKDLMQIQNRKVESVYSIPSLRAWFVESSIYPFIGGDTVERKEKMKASLLNSVNFILPYVMPGFLQGASKQAIYDLSKTCLENALAILTVLEEEYQTQFERILTLNRLNEVIISPTCPDKGGCLGYDYHLPPSVYVKNDIEKLIRLREYIH